ncbi:hypothetical protein BPAE_0079g00240 [Botrytis paeoniae]|uniref:2EXR domain-containing protein n=1 Tax=Botrytis paeoniae TaxID=278948 RepID=A0A4Z1FUS6_9HELO|nr:hypothetical protein BPAE_0079g00240 [Botrytis paeoniae]
MFLQSGKSQLANLPSKPLIFVPDPPEEFTQFSRLPLELRRKIWGFAALSHPRVFELVWCSSEDELHQLFKVSKQTNRVPPIMEVNREACEEGMHIFEKRVFNNCNINIGSPFEVEGEKPQCTWFNPDLNTIYFGENTCIRTVADFFDLCWQMKLPKIAFAMNKHVHHSCDCNWNPGDWNFVHNMLTCLQMLHGRARKDANSSMFPGSPSTREVFIVIPSFVYRFEAGEMLNTATLRYSVRCYLCEGGQRVGAIWANEIRMERGKKIRHDGFTLSSEDCAKITMGTFLEDLKLRTGVDIGIGFCSDSDDFPGRYKMVNEAGLLNGTDEGIKECTVRIMARVMNRE